MSDLIAGFDRIGFLTWQVTKHTISYRRNLVGGGKGDKCLLAFFYVRMFLDIELKRGKYKTGVGKGEGSVRRLY
jgi:hypothetical protein